MTLKKLLISQFQCHESLKVELDERVTVFVGRSDVGKSAVLRSLRWVFLNQPSGEGVRRFGSEKTRVGVGFEGHRLIRQRTKNENFYELDGSRYNAVGLGKVPDGIRDVLNTDPLINFQGQLDGPFLFSLTGGGIAEQLNTIVDLKAIDRVMGWIRKRVKEEKGTVKVLETQVEVTQKRVEALEWIDECRESYIDISNRLRRYKELGDQVRELEGLIFKARGHREVFHRSTAQCDDLREVAQSQYRLQQALNREMALTNLVRSARQYEKEAELADDVDDLYEKFKKIISLRRRVGRLYDNIDEARELNHKITRLHGEIKAWASKAGKTHPRGTDEGPLSLGEVRRNGDGVGFKCPKCGWEMLSR